MRFNPYDAHLANRADSRQGAALLSYITGYEGAYGRSISDRLSERLSVKDFGAVGDGVEDDSGAIQSAIDAASKTGASVHFPVGRYRITRTIRLRAYVTLIGEHRRKHNYDEKSTVIVVDFGDGESLNAIEYTIGCAIIGFAFYYPKQAVETASEPVVFGYTIAPLASHLVAYAPSANYCEFHDLWFQNSYKALRLESASGYHVSHIGGGPIHTGIYIERIYDVSYMHDVWFIAHAHYAVDSNMNVWIQDNGRAFDLRKADGIVNVNLGCYGYKEGFYFDDWSWYGVPDAEGVPRGHAACWGIFTNCQCDNTRYPIYAKFLSSVQFIGGHFITKNSRHASVTTGVDMNGNLRLVGCSFWGIPSVGIYVPSNSGRIVIDGCDFREDLNGVLSVPILVSGTAEVVISGCAGIKTRIPWGAGNVILDGFPLFSADTDKAPTGFDMATWSGGVPTGWTASSAETLTELDSPDGVSLALTGLSGYSLDYTIPGGLLTADSCYVLQFDLEIKAETTAFSLYFAILDAGNNILVRWGANYPLWGVGTPPPKFTVKLPLLIFGAMAKFRIAYLNSRDGGASNGTIEITNLKWYEQSTANTRQGQKDRIYYALKR
jgi:hypothetical protein